MRKLLLFGLFWSCVLGVQAQVAQSFSLEQAVEFAYLNNPTVKLANIGVANTEQVILETQSAGLPKVNFNVNWQNFPQVPISLLDARFFDPTAPAGTFAEVQFGTRNNLTASLEANTVLFDYSVLTALRARRAFRMLAKTQVEKSKQDVRNDVTQAYLATLIFKENEAIIDKNIKNVDALLFGTRETYKAGFAEQLDVDRLELTLANLKVMKSNLKRQEQMVYNNLKFMMGYPIDKPLVVSEEIDNMIENKFVGQINELLNLNNRQDYKLIQATINFNQYDIDAQKGAGYYPQLSAFGSHQQSLQRDNLFGEGNGWLPTTVWGLRLSVPLFDGFARSSKIQQVKLKLEEMETQSQQLVQAITLEVTNARISYQNALEQIEDQKKNIALAEKIYNTTQIKFKEGVGSSLEVSNAERALFDTQANYINALYDLLVAKANLAKALGK